MKPFCELISLNILPAARALIALKLTSEYGLTQVQAAERMGTTQPAISQYKQQIRGVKKNIFEDNPDLMKLVNVMAKKLATSEVSGNETTLLFCKMCREIRSSGKGCDLHKEMDSSLMLCNICDDNPEFYGLKKKGSKKKGREKTLDMFKQSPE